MRLHWNLFIAALLVGLAAMMLTSCGGSDESGVTKEQLDAALAEAVKSAPVPPAAPAPEPVQVPIGPTAEEIGALVSAAVANAVPDGTSGAEIRSMVEAAISGASSEGVTAAEIESLVAASVREAVAGVPDPLSAAEVERIVEAAVKAIPTPAPAPEPIVIVATPGPAPEPEVATTLSGSVTVALDNVGSPKFVNSRGGFPDAKLIINWGITETIAVPEGDDEAPLIAESWTLAADLSEVTLEIVRGIQFHDNWGELTAADVVYSYNEPNPAITPDSEWDNAPDLVEDWEPWEQIGDYSIRAPVKKFRGDWFRSFTPRGAAPSILSKDVFDSLGIEKALTTMVGTGPFEAAEWKSDERFVGEAIIGHWRKTPSFQTLRVLEIPEEQSRVSMMLTGEADVTMVSLKSASELSAKGFEASDGLKAGFNQGILFGGNYWIDTDPVTGDPWPRPGFKPDADHPYIGDPADPDSMERARKVRMAMSMAIDREAINDTIMAGLGKPNSISYVDLDNPYYPAHLVHPYDPEGAKQLLADAGYPDGFEFKWYVPPDVTSLVDPEVGEAVAAMWTNIGLKPQTFNTAYGTHRPTLVDHALEYPWLFVAASLGRPYTTPRPWEKWQIPPVCFGGFCSMQMYDWHESILTEDDPQKIIDVNNMIVEYVQHQALLTGIVEAPTLVTLNPQRIRFWDMRSDLFPNRFETIIFGD